MASFKNTTVNDTGYIQLPKGDNSTRPAASTAMLRFNTALGAPEYYDGTTWISLGQRDGTTAAKAVYKSTDIKTVNPSATNGWYWMYVNGTAKNLYMDMSYDGGGWVLAASHPINVSIPALTYAQAAQGVDYIGSSGFATGGTNDPKTTSSWLGLAAWNYICAANGAGRNFVYYTAGSQVALNATGSHNRRSRWTWTGWSGTYAWQGIAGLSNEAGGTTPGLYGYATAPYSFTTYDVDQDTYGGNCAGLYNNAPWWYNACWDGHFWGGNGNGYANASFWTGSSGDYYTYGAFYVK